MYYFFVVKKEPLVHRDKIYKNQRWMIQRSAAHTQSHTQTHILAVNTELHTSNCVWIEMFCVLSYWNIGCFLFWRRATSQADRVTDGLVTFGDGLWLAWLLCGLFLFHRDIPHSLSTSPAFCFLVSLLPHLLVLELGREMTVNYFLSYIVWLNVGSTVSASVPSRKWWE